jgi:hypothetical protein
MRTAMDVVLAKPQPTRGELVSMAAIATVHSGTVDATAICRGAVISRRGSFASRVRSSS